MVTVFSGNLKSRLLDKELPYMVVLPTNYGKTEKKFPVLYLLHGLFGSCQNWIELTELLEHSEKYNFIIVTLEGADSWYVNSAEIKQNKFESYIISELIPEIDALYQTENNRASRAIVGLSMGGYGAVKFAIKYPDLFAFAGSISGAFDAPRQTEKNQGVDWAILKPSILRAFGEENSNVRIENDLFLLVPQIVEKDRLPCLYVDCGNEDSFLPINLDFHNLLNQNSISHDYFIGSGGHDWDYWNQRIKEILKIVANIFA